MSDCRSACLSACLVFWLSVRVCIPPVCQPVCPSDDRMSVCLSVWLSVSLSNCLRLPGAVSMEVCPPFYPFVCPCVCLCLSFIIWLALGLLMCLSVFRQYVCHLSAGASVCLLAVTRLSGCLPTRVSVSLLGRPLQSIRALMTVWLSVSLSISLPAVLPASLAVYRFSCLSYLSVTCFPYECSCT